jgi:hypothetical protein
MEMYANESRQSAEIGKNVSSSKVLFVTIEEMVKNLDEIHEGMLFLRDCIDRIDGPGSPEPSAPFSLEKKESITVDTLNGKLIGLSIKTEKLKMMLRTQTARVDKFL